MSHLLTDEQLAAIRARCKNMLADAQERRDRESAAYGAPMPILSETHVRITLMLGKDLLTVLAEIERLKEAVHFDSDGFCR